MPTTPECDYDIVSNEGLLSLLRSESKKIVILDCRSSIEYGECHIREAVNFSIPSIMLRRLAAGKIDLASTIKCRELKQKICSTYKENLFVLYNDLSGVQQHQADSVLNVLLRRLTQDGCRVVCLKDEFQTFRNSYPEWCDSCSELLDNSGGTMPSAAGPDPLPLMGLRSLRISAPPLHRPHRSCDSLSSTANSSTDSSDTDDRCDSSLALSGLEDDREFPVEILPHLFLGNAANSEDSQSLERHGIQYILNVTPDLPNVFEKVGHYKYMQIPITDHWSQNLASHFPKAIEFIGYLKNEKLYSVFDEFLKSCPYLTENKQNIKIGKYFATRVAGMTLVDFLKEYAIIYTIVQSRLEETNYYETYSRTSLVERVMYLLDKEVPTVTTLTPDTPVSTVKSSRITSEVDATLAHSLPENNEETSSTVESSVREQPPGVGVTSLPTQKISITPEIALTPVDLVSSNQKSTDYSTLNSDSDFQPGGNKKTITCKRTDENSNINKNINTVEEKNTLPQETFKNIFMPRLEEFLEGFITEEVKKLPLEKSVKNNRKEEITKIKRRTFDTVLDFQSKPKKKKDEKENQLMGNLQDGSSEKGEKWRCRDSENNKKVEVKALERNIQILKKIDVDKFLDKVYKK